MKTIKPDFYDTFQCTADKCTFTCCQEWKIAVDEKTEEKWKNYPNPDQESKMLCESVTEKDDTRIIALNREKKCPFLDDNRLCKLVTNYGEEILSKTCQTFPRQIHHFQMEDDAIHVENSTNTPKICSDTQEERIEYSLVACCPAVVDIWMEQEEIQWVEDISETREICFSVREEMFSIMKDRANSNEKNMLLLFFMLLDLEEVCPNEEITDSSEDDIEERNRKLWSKLQEYRKSKILTQVSEKIDQMEFSTVDTFIERNELFLDMIENYRKEKLYERYLDQIALLAERISEETFTEENRSQEEIPSLTELNAFQKEMQPYESLFRNFLVSEIFTNILIPGGDLESMVVMTQWMAMEYAVMQHAVFLRWYLDGKRKLTYEILRDYMVLCARITGYDQEDIYEYMENSFESILWDWGYMALLIGKGIKEESEDTI